MHASAQLALIDEPTNHMDFVAKRQFIDWLKSAKEAMLVITHDRDVLHEVDKIIEIKDSKAFSYKGNYDAYLRQNAVSATAKLHDHEINQRQIENLKAKLIQFRRLKEKARDPDTIKQFKRRENETAKLLAELQAIPKPSIWIDKLSTQDLSYKVESNYHKYKTKNIRINNLSNSESRSKRLLVEVSGLSLGYEAWPPLFGDLNFQLREKERLEFRGRNGAGKTTLIKAIMASSNDQKPPIILNGSIQVEPKLSIGMYEQEISSAYFGLSLHDAIIRLYLDAGLSISDERAMRLMGDYLFNPVQDGKQPVSSLSGGQKSRFQLISMLKDNPQLLILDEPTNHLDLPSIEELESAIEKYAGAVIYVSHDGYFQSKIGGEVVKIG